MAIYNAHDVHDVHDVYSVCVGGNLYVFEDESCDGHKPANQFIAPTMGLSCAASH